MNEPMKLGPPAVENMSDVSWARVERGVFTRLDGAGTVTGAVSSRDYGKPTRAKWTLFVVPVAAAAAFLLVFAFSHGGNGPSSQTAQSEPARVVSGSSPSAVSFGDAHITLDADSALEMVGSAAQPTALLERGAAWFSVAPRGDRPAFEVHAGDMIVRVIGTRFRVARDGERASVTVDHGVVEVRYRGRAMRLADGQSWSTDP